MQTYARSTQCWLLPKAREDYKVDLLAAICHTCQLICSGCTGGRQGPGCVVWESGLALAEYLSQHCGRGEQAMPCVSEAMQELYGLLHRGSGEAAAEF